MNRYNCPRRPGRRPRRFGPPFVGFPLALLLLVIVAWHLQTGGAARFAPPLLLVTALGIALFGYVTGRFARRLERLRRAVESINLTDLSARVGAMGHDSVGVLAQAFDRMVERLEAEERVRRNLFADVAHELRHPLALLRGRLESIQDRVVPLDEGQVMRLQDDVIALSRLVDDLRDLSLADVGRLRLDLGPIDLGAFTQDLAADLTPVADDRHVALTFRVSPDLPIITADAARLRQVLVNLLTNALGHTPDGGSVALSAAMSQGMVGIAVADTGEGIPPERLPHIFERFYRADDGHRRGSREGTGLGLAIVKSLVELHGGTVSVISAPTRGTTFTVRLPTEPNR